MNYSLRAWWVSFLGCAVAILAIAASDASVVYHCPGNVITNEISARQAQQQGCRVQASANVTVLPESPQPAAAALPASAPAALQAPPVPARQVAVPTTPADKANVQASSLAQRGRDSDAHYILSAELKREQLKLTVLRQMPLAAERAEAIARSESDIAALERELARHAVKVGR